MWPIRCLEEQPGLVLHERIVLPVHEAQVVTRHRHELTVGVPLPGLGDGMALARGLLRTYQNEHRPALRLVRPEDIVEDPLLKRVLNSFSVRK